MTHVYILVQYLTALTVVKISTYIWALYFNSTRDCSGLSNDCQEDSSYFYAATIIHSAVNRIIIVSSSGYRRKFLGIFLRTTSITHTRSDFLSQNTRAVNHTPLHDSIQPRVIQAILDFSTYDGIVLRRSRGLSSSASIINICA